MTRVALGSLNDVKIGAVIEACQRIGFQIQVISFATQSGVNEQPIGLEETLRGAQERAEAARRSEPNAVCVGIESGILRAEGVSIDLAVIVVLTRSGKRIVSTSAGMSFPEVLVRETETLGFEKHTVGSMIADVFNGDAADPHRALSNGALTRGRLLVTGLSVAFAQVDRW